MIRTFWEFRLSSKWDWEQVPDIDGWIIVGSLQLPGRVDVIQAALASLEDARDLPQVDCDAYFETDRKHAIRLTGKSVSLSLPNKQRGVLIVKFTCETDQDMVHAQLLLPAEFDL